MSLVDSWAVVVSVVLPCQHTALPLGRPFMLQKLFVCINRRLNHVLLNKRTKGHVLETWLGTAANDAMLAATFRAFDAFL